MTQTEALKLALEALKRVLPHAKESMTNPELDIDILDAHAAITAIEARLSPQNELEAHWNEVRASYGARQAALEAKDEPVGLIESLKDAQPCCGQYATCWRACTPRGKFIGQRDAQRKSLTDEEIQDALEVEFLGSNLKRNWQDDLRVARAIEAAHGIKGEA